MFVGFDYGTSNCAMARIEHDRVQLIPLYDDEPLVPSTLYALDRSLISHNIWQHLAVGTVKNQFAESRRLQLQKAQLLHGELAINSEYPGVYFGHDAVAHHAMAPTEGYFIKSPKSFLGASGLRQPLVELFEDVVTAMMLNVKHRAELSTGQVIDQTVIGRPVNFQGLNADVSNRQAEAILLAAGRRAGFCDIEFLYEPLAAGFDFETRMIRNQRVLVVDIGGGTTDCSMVLMGPDHIKQRERRQDFLGHTGERIGGNDFDIQFALNALMPEFGLHSPLKNGLPMPRMPFAQAAAINDVGAQAEFYSARNALLINSLARDTSEPALFKRFVDLLAAKQNFALVRAAENTKIALSSVTHTSACLDFIENNLRPLCCDQQLAEASAGLIAKIQQLVKEATRQAGDCPEVVYLTGGSAKSPLIRRALADLFGDEIPLVEGDFFGSVVSGLSIWAQRIFR